MSWFKKKHEQLSDISDDRTSDLRDAIAANNSITNTRAAGHIMSLAHNIDLVTQNKNSGVKDLIGIAREANRAYKTIKEEARNLSDDDKQKISSSIQSGISVLQIAAGSLGGSEINNACEIMQKISTAIKPDTNKRHTKPASPNRASSNESYESLDSVDAASDKSNDTSETIQIGSPKSPKARR